MLLKSCIYDLNLSITQLEKNIKTLEDMGMTIDSIEKYFLLAEANKSLSDVLRQQIGNKVHTISVNDVELARLKGIKYSLEDLSINAQYAYLSYENIRPIKKYKIEDIQIEINEGFIENIVVTGEVSLYHKDPNGYMSGSEVPLALKFDNRYPIGVSRRRDFTLFEYHNLYARKNYQTYIMRLEDIIANPKQFLEQNRQDFSPSNQVVKFSRNSVDDCKTLTKDPTYRLFEVKVFSDFVGFDEQNPNGIIQTELSRRINIRTEHKYLPEKYRRKIRYFGDNIRSSRRWQWFDASIGWLPYIEPSLVFSKLEESRKYLQLYTIDENNISTLYTSSIQLRRFEKINVGLTLGILAMYLPNWKSKVYLNTGVNFSRVPVEGIVNAVDTFRRELNTFAFNLELPWEIRADERYGLTMFWRTSFYHLPERTVRQTLTSVPIYGNLTATQNFPFDMNKVNNSIELFGYFNPDPYGQRRGRFFARYRFHWAWKAQRENFSQMQVGYSLFLLTKK